MPGTKRLFYCQLVTTSIFQNTKIVMRKDAVVNFSDTKTEQKKNPRVLCANNEFKM